MTASELHHIAELILTTILLNATRDNLKSFIDPLYTFMNISNIWLETGFTLLIFDVVAKAIQSSLAIYHIDNLISALKESKATKSTINILSCFDLTIALHTHYELNDVMNALSASLNGSGIKINPMINISITRTNGCYQ